MTVDELIKELQKYPGDMDVKIEDHEYPDRRFFGLSRVWQVKIADFSLVAIGALSCPKKQPND